MTPPRIARCPQCGQPAELSPQNGYRPFCSERCKLLDLGAWASGRYAIPSADDESDPEEPRVEEGRHPPRLQ
jgi:endogenous inhibitor of DNA gyrase (YacG/DUF329 family)